MSIPVERREKWLPEEMDFMTRLIRPATTGDAKACSEIYAPIVMNTHTSFEMEPPDEAEMQERIKAKLPHFPWLVYCVDETVIGYAYASSHKPRQAYQWAADTSIYVSPAVQRHGVGRALYRALFGTLREQGYFRIFAGVALPNEASMGLHLAMGFEQIGIYKAAGYKQGKWHDVAWFQLSLQELMLAPTPPIPFAEIRASEPFNRILAESIPGDRP